MTPSGGLFLMAFLALLPGCQKPAAEDPAPVVAAPSAQRAGAPGAALPFGRIAIACAMRGKPLGKEVAHLPRHGRQFRLYDTAPGKLTPHSHFLTGFDDHCPRQFTAALAILGTAAQHEAVRYDTPVAVLAYSSTDTAYERLKRRICHVAKGKPCRAAGARKMARSAVFVTFYESFATSARWGEALLSDGKVVARDVQGRL